MTTRDLAVRWTETKERKGWGWLKAMALTVTVMPVLLVAALVDGAVLAQTDEEGSSDGFR
jgi:hypothetical protein